VPNPFLCSRYNALRGLRVESLSVEFHECQQITSVLRRNSCGKVVSLVLVLVIIRLAIVSEYDDIRGTTTLDTRTLGGDSARMGLQVGD
jgi:hypothetical protein